MTIKYCLYHHTNADRTAIRKDILASQCLSAYLCDAECDAMTKYHFEVGDTVGQWTLIEKTTIKVNGYNRTVFVCKCSCGFERKATPSEIARGLSINGMCYKCVQRARAKRGEASPCYIHGASLTPLGHVWQSMMARCENPKHKAYPNYGGRGISVCKEWHDYQTFKTWAESNGYDSGLQLDRIDNNQGYFPENCRFVSCKVNQNNKRSNRRLEYQGETHTISEWNDILGFPRSLINRRLYAGWSVEKALSTPYTIDYRIEYNGENLLISEWAKRLGVCQGTIRSRLSRGWSPQDAVSIPPKCNHTKK